MGPKKSILLLILISASLLSASFAGAQRKLLDNSMVQVESEIKESPNKFLSSEEAFVAHPRILTVKTSDYGSYDPSPSLDKPPHKLIPN